MGGINGVMFFLGLSAGFHVPSAIATITAMVSRKDWGKALGMHQTAPSLSLVLAPLLVQYLLARLSWWLILVCLGAVSLGTGIVFVLFARSGDFRGEAPRPEIIKTIAGQASPWIMVLLFALAIGGSIGLYSMLPLYLISERGFEQGWANAVLGLSRITGLFMAFVAGMLTDRLGEKRALSGVFLSAGIATVLLGAVPDSWLVWIVFIQAAVVVCFFPPGFSALSRIVPPNLRSVTTSLVTPSAFLLGGGIVPVFIGYMGERQAFGLGIALIGCLMVLSPLMIRFLVLRDEEEDGC
jgi:NNP family nitrate/nitrite transporter-like MFS transporter